MNATTPDERLSRMRKSFEKDRACSLRITDILPRRMLPLSRVCPFPGVKLRIGRRNSPRRNPQNGVEGIHRIEAAVKTKHEFIEIGLQMTRLDPAMVSAIDPCLQVGEDKMDHRQVLFRLIWVTPEGKRIVPDSPYRQARNIPASHQCESMEPAVTLSFTNVVSVSASRPERGISVCSMLETTRSRRRPA